jgi:hypothetical protein
MPFIPAPNTLQVRMRGNWGTQLWENTLYFEGSAGVSTALANQLGAALVTWWGTHFQPILSNSLALGQVYITDMTADNSFVVVYTTGLPLVGQNTTESLPYNCAFVVSLRTANRGRSGRGRNYVPGLTEAQQAGSTIAAGTRTTLVAAYQLLVGAGVFVPGLDLSVVSRRHNKQDRVTCLVQPVVSVTSIDAIMDSQRRRLPGRGR